MIELTPVVTFSVSTSYKTSPTSKPCSSGTNHARRSASSIVCPSLGRISLCMMSFQRPTRESMVDLTQDRSDGGLNGFRRWNRHLLKTSALRNRYVRSTQSHDGCHKVFEESLTLVSTKFTCAA